MRRTPFLGFLGALIILAFSIGCSGGETTATGDTGTTPPVNKPADDSTPPKADFATIKAGIDGFCMPCHDATNKQGGVDMTAFKSEADVNKTVFAKMAEEVEAKKMPPSTAGKQPSDEERSALVTGLKALGS
jgi:uncharacterized membrane protein